MAHAKVFKHEITPLEIGGKVRNLQFDLNSYAELEKRYGTVQAAMDELNKGNISSLRVLLWAGLIHEEAVVDEFTGEPIKYNITPYEVGSWVGPGMLEEISTLLGKSISSTLPEGVTLENAKDRLKVLTTEQAEKNV